MKTSFKTLSEFISNFQDEKVCRQYFEAIRFKDGDFCPHCGYKKVMRFTDGKRYRCHSCKKDFTIKTGTLFGESKIPLTKWFIAIYLLTSAKKGISSIYLAEQVGVSQKTAWYMDMRIREALKQNGGKLFGTVEIDETYIGGKEKNKHLNKRTKHTQGRSTTVKVPIVGFFQRQGNVITKVVPDVTADRIETTIKKHVRKGSKVYTDDFWSYRNLGKNFKHKSVSHGRGEYVRGNIHSNGAESFWALFKRGYHGTYHTMSKKHLQRYVDEFAFRYNNRELSFNELLGTVVEKMGKSDRISYKSLTA